MNARDLTAVQIDAYGPPAALIHRVVPRPSLASTEVRIRTLAAAVNHTDLQIRAGNWPIRKANPFPYTPGVEVVGTIIETGTSVNGWSVGQCVITLMQGLGGVRAERPGGYAQEVVVSADALALIPPTIKPLDMAAVGLPGVTAYNALKRLGDLEGRRVLITGAAGGVGSAATALAQAVGGEVTGLVSKVNHIDYVRSLGAKAVFVTDESLTLAPKHFDYVLDVVGGSLFGRLVDTLRDGGGLSLVGAVSGGQVSFDAWNLIRPVTLTGYSTENLTGVALREAIDEIAKFMEKGLITVPTYQLMPMTEARAAHERLENHGVKGRLLLVPDGTAV